MIETLLSAMGVDPAKVLNSFDASQVPEQPGGLVNGAAPPAAPPGPPALEE
jgi:hypothetical protein